MFFVQGANEVDGRAEVFADWYPMVDAPMKDLVVFDTSGHRPLWEQPIRRLHDQHGPGPNQRRQLSLHWHRDR